MGDSIRSTATVLLTVAVKGLVHVGGPTQTAQYTCRCGEIKPMGMLSLLMLVCDSAQRRANLADFYGGRGRTHGHCEGDGRAQGPVRDEMDRFQAHRLLESPDGLLGNDTHHLPSA